jgi:hypothetical protein
MARVNPRFQTPPSDIQLGRKIVMIYWDYSTEKPGFQWKPLLWGLSKVRTFHYLNGQSQITFLASPFQSLKQQKRSSFGTRTGLSSELHPSSFSGHFGRLF